MYIRTYEVITCNLRLTLQTDEWVEGQTDKHTYIKCVSPSPAKNSSKPDLAYAYYILKLLSWSYLVTISFSGSKMAPLGETHCTWIVACMWKKKELMTLSSHFLGNETKPFLHENDNSNGEKWNTILSKHCVLYMCAVNRDSQCQALISNNTASEIFSSTSEWHWAFVCSSKSVYLVFTIYVI